MNIKLIITALVSLSILIGNARAETINLSVAASMTDGFKEILALYSSSHPGVTLQPNFASSGSLVKQIEQGAPADIYVSANPKWMQYLVDMQLIEPGTVRILAYNSLVFVGREDRSVDLGGLIQLDRIALGTPQSVPAGHYARQAMENAGVYAELAEMKKLVLAKDVRQALLYADQGEVDGAFVYRTDALLATDAKILFVVPAELYDPVSYPVALTGSGRKKESARAFYEFLNSHEAMAVLKKYGFQPIR